MFAALFLGLVSPTPQSAYDMYYRSLAAMKSISVPPYVTYSETENFTHKTKIKRFVLRVTERTSDHKARYVGTNPDGSQTSDVAIRVAFLPPDAFLQYVQPIIADKNAFTIGVDDAAIRTIARVHSASNYEVTLRGQESVDWCPSAYHLALAPKSDPLRYNIRDLWIDQKSYQICQADVVRMVSIGSRIPATMRIKVRQDGYISEYSTTATGRMFGFPYTLTDDVLMTDPIASRMAPGAL